MTGVQTCALPILDRLSNGRFIFGIGAGGLAEETEIMGGDFEHRWGQTREAILAMKELWTKGEAEIVLAFADYYRDGGRATNGWSDPVAALVRTLPVQIAKGRKGHNRPPPKVFSVNSQVFTGLYFNLESQAFEFYAPIRMSGNPLWLSVTEIMQKGPGHFIGQIFRNPELEASADTYTERLNSIGQIREIELHIEEVTGEDKTVDIVVDIFNRVNSGGTKLSKGDLALAKICAQWPDARNEMKIRLDKWQKAGFHFKLEWLLRCINAIVTGEALFGALDKVDVASINQGLQQAEKSIDTLLNLISGVLASTTIGC